MVSYSILYYICIILLYIIKIYNKEETIKWKDAGDFVYVILYQVIYKSVYRFLNVLYFMLKPLSS